MGQGMSGKWESFWRKPGKPSSPGKAHFPVEGVGSFPVSSHSGGAAVLGHSGWAGRKKWARTPAVPGGVW